MSVGKADNVLGYCEQKCSGDRAPCSHQVSGGNSGLSVVLLCKTPLSSFRNMRGGSLVGPVKACIARGAAGPERVYRPCSDPV